MKHYISYPISQANNVRRPTWKPSTQGMGYSRSGNKYEMALKNTQTYGKYLVFSVLSFKHSEEKYLIALT